MCLNDAKVNVKELFGRKKKSIILWKVVSKDRNGFSAVCQSFHYKLDKANICDRKNKRINKTEDPYFKKYQSIDKGFHFFRDFSDAYRWTTSQPSDEVIVPVICDREDYVAHNKEQAVFMKFRFLNEKNTNNGFKKEYTNNFNYYLDRLS